MNSKKKSTFNKKSNGKPTEKLKCYAYPKCDKSFFLEKGPKVSPSINPNIRKTPISTKNNSIFGMKVSWCHSKADTEGRWSWHEPRQWTDKEWEEDIFPLFEEFSKKTWAEIDTFASGTGHKMHHSQNLSDLIKEAHDRWNQLGLEEFDVLFRFRLGGKKRAWGYIVQSHFFLIWWDRNHKLYYVEKKSSKKKNKR